MVLLTKLKPPCLKPRTLRRERLLRLLQSHLERKLVLVIGDAGYGKTVLLVQAIQELGLPAVFYHLDRGDSDLTVFLKHLTTGLEALDPGRRKPPGVLLAARTKGLLERDGEAGRSPELLMGTLINELVEKRKGELFFVFDDYQALSEASPVHAALDYFIAHLPDTVRTVIASRKPPPLPSLARWQAKQDLFELSREDLAFTEEEVEDLLRDVYPRLASEEERRQLTAQTEGWITGIQMVLQAAGREKKTIRETLKEYLEADRPLFDYFAREVLASEPREIQDFLARSSLLDVLTPEACRAVLGRRDSAELLRSLERRHLFLARVGEEQYKLHPLFREFLKESLPDPRARAALHRRAAEYYQRKGRAEQVIEHCLQAGEYGAAAKAILEVAGEFEDRARFETLKNWMSQLPKEVVDGQPRLLVLQGKLFLEAGLLAEAEEALLQAERLLGKKEQSGKGGSATLAEALVERGKLFWRKGAYDAALTVLKKALGRCPASQERVKGDIFNLMGLGWDELGDPGKAKSNYRRAKAILERLPDPFGVIAVESNLATLLHKQGEARQVFALYRSLIERIRGSYFWGVGFVFDNAARNALDVGQADWAEQCLNQGLALCVPYRDATSQAVLHRGFGALHGERGQWDRAREHLETAKQGFTKLGWMMMQPGLLRDLGRLARYRRDFAESQRYVAEARAAADPRDRYMASGLLAEQGFLEVSRGEFGSAERSFKASLSLARRFGWKREEFLSLLGRAEVAEGREMRKEGLGWLTRAVRLARRKGYDGLLARELRHSPRLQSLAHRCAREKKYLAPLLPSEAGSPERSHRAFAVRLFGSLQIGPSPDNMLPLKWRSRKAASLLAYLLLHRDRACDREELIQALWPRAGKQQAEQSLRFLVFRLKKTLASGLRQAGRKALAKAPLVVHQARGYRLAPSLSFRLDVEEFLAQWEQARALEREGREEESRKACEGCLALYRDDFLPDLAERWCEERRQEYEKQFLSALRNLARARLESRDWEGAVTCLRRYLKKEPYSEEVHRELWKGLKGLELKADIQRDYKELKRLVQRDLKAELDPETEQAFKEAMGG